VRKSSTWASRSLAITDTCERDRPVIPNDWTSLSVRRVLKSAGKSFEISKWEVWEAYRQVKANKGAPGVDKVTIQDFETDL
jgi:hypothetical protein